MSELPYRSSQDCICMFFFVRDRGFIKAVQRVGLAAGIICLVTLRHLVSYGWYVSITIVFSIAAL